MDMLSFKACRALLSNLLDMLLEHRPHDRFMPKHDPNSKGGEQKMI